MKTFVIDIPKAFAVLRRKYNTRMSLLAPRVEALRRVRFFSRCGLDMSHNSLKILRDIRKLPFHSDSGTYL